jgi:hypothetical protein
MVKKSRVVRWGVVAVALSVLPAAAWEDQPQLEVARRASSERSSAFPGDFRGCGSSDGIPTTGCVIVRNHTRGWTEPGEPGHAGGLVLSATRRAALTTGGSNGWVQPMVQRTRGSSSTNPVLDRKATTNGLRHVWAGGWCRTAAARCQISTWWTIGATNPRNFEEAIRQRGGEAELYAQMRTAPAGSANTGAVTGNPWVSLIASGPSSRGQNARMNVTATNYTVGVTVRNRVRDQRLQFNRRPDTTSAVEVTKARLPQSQNGANLMNGSLVLAQMVGNTPGRGKYGYITHVAGRVQIRMEFEWIGSPGVTPNGNRAEVTIDFTPGTLSLTDNGTCTVTGSFAPTCRVNLSASTLTHAAVDIVFEDR